MFHSETNMKYGHQHRDQRLEIENYGCTYHMLVRILPQEEMAINDDMCVAT